MAITSVASSSQLQFCNTLATNVCTWRGYSPTSKSANVQVMATLASDHSQSSSESIPKMEPFNRGRVSRLMREPSLLEKAEHALSDRCSVLEGDDAFKCWEAFFDFEDLKEEYKSQCEIAPPGQRQTACQPLERLENLVRQSGGTTSLINNVRMLAKVNELRKAGKLEITSATTFTADSENDNVINGDDHIHFFPEPGALPPSEEELEMERTAKMPESSFTRVLRKMGNPSSWFGVPTDF